MIRAAGLHRLTTPALLLALGLAIPVSVSAQAMVRQDEERRPLTVSEVLEVVGRAIEQPAPADLSAAGRRNYVAQTEWLKTVQARLQATGKRLGILQTPDTASGEAVAQRRIRRIRRVGRGETNKEIESLKQTLLKEGRGLQTMSNVSKARHDVAMKAIQNMRA